MNKLIENTMRTRETAKVTSFVRGLDVAEGDVVQVRGPGHHAGRLGVVIGVLFYKNRDDLRLNVQFSDGTAALFSGERLELVRPNRDEGK